LTWKHQVTSSAHDASLPAVEWGDDKLWQRMTLTWHFRINELMPQKGAKY